MNTSGSQIKFTVVGTDRHGRDIIAFYLNGQTRVSRGEGLADKLRSDPKFIEARQLPNERPVHEAA